MKILQSAHSHRSEFVSIRVFIRNDCPVPTGPSFRDLFEVGVKEQVGGIGWVSARVRALVAKSAARRILVSLARLAALSLIAGLSAASQAQNRPVFDVLSAATPPGLLPDAPIPQADDTSVVTLRNTPHHILADQKAIWTSPAHIHVHNLVWLAPLAAAEGAAIATDHHTMSSVVSHDAAFNQDNVNASNIAIGSFIALPVGLYGFGYLHENDHAEESGILGGEALLDGVVVEQGMKLIFWRERPSLDNTRGHFFQSDAGIDSSFPSSHSVLAWAEASTLAGEYASPRAKLGLYSVAAGISMTRILGQEHFPGDVLAGSAAGWLVGHYVFRAHHHRLSADTR